jgi:hypothetical protein
LEMDERARAEAAQLTGNHPKRLALLAMAGDLPWMTHWDLLRRAAKAVGTSKLSMPVDVEWHRDTPRAQRSAIQAEAATLVQMLAMLVLLSSDRSCRRRRTLHPRERWPHRDRWWSPGRVLLGHRGVACPSLLTARATSGWARSGGAL